MPIATAPPRRGSPPPLRAPVRGSRATACTPPKNRLISGPAGDRQAPRREPHQRLPRRCRARPGRAPARSAAAAPRSPPRTGRPCSTTRTTVCRIAERIRLEPALPRPSSISPSRRTTVGAIIEGTRRPGVDLVEALRVEVLLAEHVVEDHPGSRHQHARAGAVGAGDAGAHAVGVEHRDVGGRAEQVAGGEVETGRVEGSASMPSLVERLGELEIAQVVGGAHRGDQLLGAAALAEALQQAEAVGDQDPARGRRRVGQHLGAAERRPRSGCASIAS